MAGGVEGRERSAAAEVDLTDLANGVKPLRLGGEQLAEEGVHLAAEHLPGGRHQSRRVCQMACPALVHDHGGARVRPGDVAHSARVVEVDVGHDDRRKVCGVDAECGERLLHNGRAQRCAGLHEGRALSPDQVPRSDARVAAHLGVDLEDVVAEVGDPRRGRGRHVCVHSAPTSRSSTAWGRAHHRVSPPPQGSGWATRARVPSRLPTTREDV